VEGQTCRHRPGTGVFDATFGTYRACGVWKRPPVRQYTEG
jgi:hypothetical protein